MWVRAGKRGNEGSVEIVRIISGWGRLDTSIFNGFMHFFMCCVYCAWMRGVLCGKML